MDNHVTAGRLAPIALGALLVVAGCADTAPAQSGSAAPSAVAAQSSVRSSDTSPDSGPTVTSVSPTAATTVATTPRSSTSTAARRGPAAGATPVFTVTVNPTLYCETGYTLTPKTVVYDDGTVLIADTIGAYCDDVPRVRVGTIDLGELDRLARGFFESPDADADLSKLPVSDLPVTTVSYKSNGAELSVDAYGLGAEDIGFAETVPADQLRARKNLLAFVDAISARAEKGPQWVPDRLVVVGGMPGGRGYPFYGDKDDVRRWPIPLTAPVRAAVSAPTNKRSCALISGIDQVAKVLRANGNRPIGALWTVDGRSRSLAIGVRLPAFPGCRG